MTLTEIDKYELRQHLGNGAFGDVYLAHDRALDAVKAIKVLDVSDPSQFMKKLEEAQILHKCRHKHIVVVNEANIYQINGESKVVIDMEYLPRGCFEGIIENGTTSIHDSISYAIDCLFALEHAHNQGILHRDIKPANIMLCDYGAKLSDFGLATVLGNRQAGSPNGYTTHLAPEYFQNKATTELTDIYAMGITLFRACNYISDWRGAVQSLRDPNQKIIDGKLVSAIGFRSFVPSKLRRIINKACAINPAKRFQSASEVRQALEKIQLIVDWKKVDEFSWQGSCKKTSKSFAASINSDRTQHKVEIKQNNRRLADSCKVFSCPEEAKTYMHEHIANTTVK
jgi:eukaryotic-like serine/threonine-protein kinase